MQKFVRIFATGACLGFALTSDGLAEPRVFLGVVTQTNNDVFGDGADRWQSASLATSLIWGPNGRPELPLQPFEILELRVRADLRTPESIFKPDPDDRLYAGTLWAGVHTQWASRGWQFGFGLDLAATGPQTGLEEIQTALHGQFGGPRVRVDDQRVENQILGHLTMEAGRPWALGAATLRPFTELQIGAETLLRGGIDIAWGAPRLQDLAVRDPVTGQRSGLGMTQGLDWYASLGADLAHVQASIFFPTDRGPELTPHRARLRVQLGVHAEHTHWAVGLTYLSPEFEGQAEGQLVGSLTVSARF